MVCSVGQQRPRKEARHFLDCMRAWAAWVCGARTGWSFMWRLSALSHSFLLPFSLLFSLSFFSFLYFLFFYISLLFFFFFTSIIFLSKPRLTPSWNKDTPLDGWNLKCDAIRFPPHLDFCVKVKCAMSGSPFECISTPKSIKVFSWCSPYVLRHRMSPKIVRTKNTRR